RDFNIVFPLDRFRELVSRGIVGALTPVHFSFMGHIDGPHIRTLQEHIAPQLVQALKRMHADVAFLTPA
ncbi:MAG: hypothetical protein HY652_03205, partial [Acidobacteria bacterium]|nr:hypothetical protein [Acidobacteriota bacterium]